MNASHQSSGNMGQFMSDQTPAFESNLKKKKGRRKNQIISQQGIIRPDKRNTVRYL